MIFSNLINSAIESLLSFSLSIGYLGTFVWMLIESSFIPWPSELLLIPQGALAHQGQLSFVWLLISATLGSLAGALINYYLAFYLGRRTINHLVNRYGKLFFLDKEKLSYPDKYFEKHGEITTFIGRLIPAVRQLISLPAGFARMSLAKFMLFTSLGAGIWSAILLYFGFILGENLEAIQSNIHLATLLIVAISLLIIFVYLLIKLRVRSRVKNSL